MSNDATVIIVLITCFGVTFHNLRVLIQMLVEAYNGSKPIIKIMIQLFGAANQVLLCIQATVIVDNWIAGTVDVTFASIYIIILVYFISILGILGLRKALE